MDKLQEDTVSADRKERIIFDPEAWRKKDKSGKKTSAITSRQNFDNEKFTRNAKEDKVDESVAQVNGTSQSDLISKTKIPKSNSPQIEFVTGKEKVKGTHMDNEPRQGIKKIAEDLVKKAVQQVSEGKMGEKAAGDLDFNAKAKKDDSVPFDGPYTKTPSTVVDKSGARHTPMSRVRHLARQGMNKEEIELKQEETDMSKTYADFIQQLQEYNAGKDGVYRHKGTYGGSYNSNDDEDDETPKKPAAPAVKRGRGRPAGSKSGANQKVTTGKSYGGIATHSLSLPNSNR
jgi:hypothetical protein